MWFWKFKSVAVSIGHPVGVFLPSHGLVGGESYGQSRQANQRQLSPVKQPFP